MTDFSPKVFFFYFVTSLYTIVFVCVCVCELITEETSSLSWSKEPIIQAECFDALTINL